MSAGLVEVLDGKISGSGDVREAWDLLKTVIDTGKVASRKEAYLTFSRVLKITNGLVHDKEIKKIWQEFLEHGCFSIEGTDRQYDFKTILNLFNEGRNKFEISWIKINPAEDVLESAAAAINSIAIDSIGPAPGVIFLQHRLQAPNVFSMIAKSGETSVACTYGTFVETLQLFHFNFLGRRVNYPGVHIIKGLYDRISIIQERFPNMKCITLCVQEVNTHAQSIYLSLGFQQLDYVEDGFCGKPTYFYGKKLHDDAILPPSYEKFKQAYDTARHSMA